MLVIQAYFNILSRIFAFGLAAHFQTSISLLPAFCHPHNPFCCHHPARWIWKEYTNYSDLIQGKMMEVMKMMMMMNTKSDKD
jgi:hypothetical protein